MGVLGSAVCTLAALTLLSATKVEVLPKAGALPIAECEALAFASESYLIGNEKIGKVASTIATNSCREIGRIDTTTESAANISIVPRGDCDISQKAYYAQKGGFQALIVYEDEGQPLSDKDLTGGRFSDLVTIPVVAVDYKCMKTITETYPPPVVRIEISGNRLRLVVVVICIFLVVVFVLGLGALGIILFVWCWCKRADEAGEDGTPLDSMPSSGQNSNVPSGAHDAAPNGDSSSSAGPSCRRPPRSLGQRPKGSH